MNLKDLLGNPGSVSLIGPDGQPTRMTNDQLALLDHPTLLQLRKLNPDQNAQNLIGGYEHRAAAREAGSSNPMLGVSYGAAIPLYQITKMLPREMTGLQSRSSPSLSQMGQGLMGAGEGIVQGVRNWLK